ncbi:MAG: hypothetical protein LLF76_12430 [Planctomycetaceae bacterium]|nr:hypothetical protein [Planctomycetaceae bacterium]
MGMWKMAHQAMACLTAFLVVNAPLWALNSSDVTSTQNAILNGSAPANTVSYNINGRGIIEWSHLNADIADAINTLEFTGPNGFAVLNRVATMVNFNGHLKGNGGQVFIVSPYGVNIGGDATISAARFIASGLNISNSDFLAGNERFAPFMVGDVKLIGTVSNLGKIGYNADGTPNPVHDAALLGKDVLNKGAILADGGLVVLATGDQIVLATAGSDITVALDVTPAAGGTYNVVNDAAGRIENPGGTIVMAAGDTFAQAMVHGPATTKYKNNTYSVNQKGYLQAGVVELAAANEAATRSSSTTLAGSAISVGAGKVRLENTLNSGGTLTIDADYAVNALDGIASKGPMSIKANTVQVMGDVSSQSTAAIEAATFVSRGDVSSEDELLLMAETTLWGDGDQSIRSNDTVRSSKSISKITAGNVYISAEQDVQLDGDVSAVEGGVSVIAENGKIHSGESDALNVGIRGYSNDVTNDIGVELPAGEGKAAIVLLSKEPLELGPEASLRADGFYLSSEDDATNGVDDRPGMTWLQDDVTSIGGWERDEGIASDVAIYAGSQTGDVHVNTVHIQTAQAGQAEPVGEVDTLYSGPATVVFDSYHSVTMPAIETIMGSRGTEGGADNFRGFRLEVDSRVTEWLYQAVDNGTLPYAYDPAAVEAMLEQDYVLRGAGLANGAITDGRAWVLENPPVAPAVALADLELPELKGCPVELDTAANELAINTDDLQILIGKSLATNPNLQPCQACQRLLVSADALRDRDGVRVAAIQEIFSTLAPIDAPFTPEVQASVAAAMAEMAQSDPQYALASDFIDAFADYVAVINRDLKVPVGDPVIYTLNKYGESLLNSSNTNIVSYLIARTEVSGEVVVEPETL